MREHLVEAVQAAREASIPPPSNEQETCFRIIDPLLKAMGYGLQDVRIQDRDKAGQKPDYTLLPDGPATWFIEAKAWGVNIQDQHAQQAVNYANTQGKRWVLLTNGQEWRLYDNLAFGDLQVKLACVAKLHEEDIVGLLDALSRASIETRKLEEFARNARLYNVLTAQMTTADSEVTKAVVKVLRSMDGMGKITAEDVVGFWRESSSGTEFASRPSMGSLPQGDSVDLKSVPVDTVKATVLTSLGLAEVTGKTVHRIVWSTGESIAISRWKDLTVQAAVLALREGQVPTTALFSGPKAKSPLLSKREWPKHPKREPEVLPPPFSDWIVETHFSAAGHCKAAVKILSACGLDPSLVTVMIAD